MKGRSNNPKPTESLWVHAEAIKYFTSLVGIFFKSIHKKETMIIEQSARFKSPINSLKSEIKIEGPLTGTIKIMMAVENDVVGNITT